MEVIRRQTILLFFTWVQIAALFTLIPTNLALKSTVLNDTNDSVDKAALISVKKLITDDPQGVTNSWNDSINFCQWQGVTCGPRHQRVTLLDLSSSGLVGSLSPSIGNMSFLRGIRLQNNSLNGNIPQQLGQLFRLQELRLNNNSFNGNIPSSLSNCSNLEVLHLGINKLVGQIPHEFSSLTMLKLLIIHKNNLTGAVPQFIGNLTSLETFSLGGCNLFGNIPDVFHRLNNLKRLAFPENELIGTIPSSIYNLSMLESLFLDSNQLNGTLDTNLFFLQPNIQEISLPDNQFTGPLHSSVFNSTELRTLDISRNKFSGKIVIDPRKNICKFVEMSLGFNRFGTGEYDEMKFIDTLANCSSLELLDLGGNNLNGLLPESFGRLSTKLYFVRLGSNMFFGNLPSSIGNLSGLTTLDLSYNQFTGTIPLSIGRLINLQRLDLESNGFIGNIPDTLGNLSLLIELNMGMNNLNGTIPSSLGNCKKLIGLTLEQNYLTGIIPNSLFKLSSLSISLNLGGNYLSGQLPFDIGNDLNNLNELILAKNQLLGEIPSSIGSCSSLQTLNVSGNLFHGSLPRSMVSLKALQNLDISVNSFTGQIPSFLEILSLENLNISFNGFEGQVSSKGVFANASAISINDNSGLCGGIMELNLPKCSSVRSKGRKKLSVTVILIISFAVVVLCAAVVVFFFLYCRKNKGGDIDEDDNTPECIDEMPLIKVSYKMLYNATDKFSLNNMIGKGSFASVYKGKIDLDVGIIAVKVLNLHHKGGSKSFISECNALRHARHRNLVKVITCCSGSDFEGNEFKALVYEFMPNGSLDRWLHLSRKQDTKIEVSRLSLYQRVCIALDVAYALDYLHNHNGRTVVHCDLKPSNILLDEDMVAHVGDFGLSKILQSEHVNKYSSNSIGVRGTVGYAAPEYGLGGKVSTSGDIYSYGVLLLEMVTSKRPTDPMFKDGVNLHNYSSTAMMMSDHLLQIVDPLLLLDHCNDYAPLTNNNEACLRMMLQLGVACSMELPKQRIGINSVIQELQSIKDLMLDTSTN